MQFERLRKNHKRKIIIGGLILVCITSAITITTTRAKYKLTEDIPLVRGYINYIADREKPIINNVTTSVTKTEINVSVSATDNIGVTEYWYSINNGAYTKKTTSSHTFTGLSAGTTYTVKVYVKDAKGNQSNTTTKSITTNKPTGSDTILNNITVKTGTPDFSKSATTDEGVYKVSDPVYGGDSYYWRGATENNYVKFGGFCWRIVRINGDDSIRLIYDGTTCHANGKQTVDSIAVTSTKYNKDIRLSYYVGWTYGTGQRTLSGTASNAKTQLESWYNSNLASQAGKIADGKYCNDRDVGEAPPTDPAYTEKWSASGSSFYYAANTRTRKNSPSLACNSGDVYTLKVGLITADEVIYAGGVGTNSSFYLYNGQYYWTMTPDGWHWQDGWAYVKYLDSRGFLNASTSVDYTKPGLQPVINLRSDVTFSGGNGTQSSPYVVQ